MKLSTVSNNSCQTSCAVEVIVVQMCLKMQYEKILSNFLADILQNAFIHSLIVAPYSIHTVSIL
jgi:hypothetical protein